VIETAAFPPLTQLTALRFVAAFAVLLSHLDFLATVPGTPACWLYETVFRQGYCGVSFFYVLSGFILSHAYGGRLASGAIGLRSYALLRICRITPLHWIMAILFIGWLGITGHGLPGPGTIVLNLLLLHAWVPDASVHYALNGPSWSLSDELFFYAAFPWLCRMSTRMLMPLLGFATLLIAAIAAMMLVRQTGYSPTTEWLFYVAPPVRLIDFVAGMLLYRGYRLGYGLRLAGTRAEIAVTLAIPAAMIGFSLAALPMPLRWQLAYLPLMAATVLVFAHGRGALSRILCRGWPILLGEASFALYLTHRPAITLAHLLLGRAPGSDLMIALGMPPLCVALSVATFLLFERPLLHRLRQGVGAHDRARDRLKAWRLS
jgi:peptidoglycan/LPS O-acetylase OafA/YrhL